MQPMESLRVFLKPLLDNSDILLRLKTIMLLSEADQGSELVVSFALSQSLVSLRNLDSSPFPLGP